MACNDHITLLMTVWIGIFCNYVCYSMIAPFYPQLAQEKGLSIEEYSIVFGIYSIAQVLLSCLSNKLILCVGPKLVILTGLFLTGGATVLFGFLEKCPGGDVFFALSAAIRFVEGAGFASSLAGTLTIIVETYPDKPGYYVGLTESVVTMGMVAGPVIGSILYVMGGYLIPFALFGGIILATAFVGIFTISNDQSTSLVRLKCRDFCRVLQLRETILAILCVCLNIVADSYILITLTNHLQQFNLGMIQTGGIYLCLFVAYGISSPLAGKIADQVDSELLLQSVGSFIMATAFGLLGPASFISLKCEVWLVILALLLKGVGAGPLLSCSYSSCLKAAKGFGRMPDDFRTYSFVSSIISFAIPLGNLIGSFTAGIIYDRMGMEKATTMYTGIFCALGILCLILHLCGQRAKRGDPYLLREATCTCNEYRWRYTKRRSYGADDDEVRLISFRPTAIF